MAIATTVSLIGNIQVSLPGHTDSPFAWLESIAPPVLVLSTAYVLKEQVLESIERRHTDDRAFQAALAEWQAATADPEQHTNWPQVYANALRDALLRANSRRKEAVGEMTVDDWRLAVTREMQADLWYEWPEPDEETPVRAIMPANLNRRNGNDTFPKVSAGIGSGAA